MAVNEKTVYATDWTSHGGKLYRPGEQLSGRLDPGVIRHAQEAGLTTDSQSTAERAKAGEADRQRHVAELIASRSEKRDFVPREDRR